jgi:hypothetical protein
MKRYIFELTIKEQSDEFFEEITVDGKSGCDEVLMSVKKELECCGFEFDLKLK